VSALAEAGVVSWIDETDRAKVDARNAVAGSKAAALFHRVERGLRVDGVTFRRRDSVRFTQANAVASVSVSFIGKLDAHAAVGVRPSELSGRAPK